MSPGDAAYATAGDVARYGPVGAVVAAGRDNPEAVRQAAAPVVAATPGAGYAQQAGTAVGNAARRLPGLVVGALRRRR
jgi:hypothetical protein